jgi:plastocyanin
VHRITALVITAVTAALALAFTSAPAEAGGGCHSNVFTDEAKTSVELSKNCFSPTVVRVQPGDQVTWTNTDPTAHTVTGVADSWGTGQEITEGQSLSYKFDKSGVFPYFCYLHPSMAGAVVVGDARAVSAGTPAGDGVSAVSAVAPGGDRNGSAGAVNTSTDSGDGVAIWLIIGIGALAAMGGFVAATVVRGRSTRS